MMKSLSIIALCCFGAVAIARGDSATAAVQQKLKDQGFYYGEISGNNDADTTAAIRRYQIRNGLKITGELNAETQKSLGAKGSSPPKSATPPPVRDQSSSAPSTKSAPTPDTSDLRENASAAPQRAPTSQEQPTFQPGAPQPGYAPGPRGLYPATNGMFNGTPYEVAPADVQRRVLIGAQTLLTQRGYYRGAIDGEAGPGTTSAVRAYQARFRLSPTGRLDMQTLGALGLLPGQTAPGMDVRRRRVYRQPGIAPGPGERLYTPR